MSFKETPATFGAVVGGFYSGRVDSMWFRRPQPRRVGNLINSPGFEGAFGGSGTTRLGLPGTKRLIARKGMISTTPAGLNGVPEIVSAPLIHSGGKLQHIGVYRTPLGTAVCHPDRKRPGRSHRFGLTAWGRVSRASHVSVSGAVRYQREFPHAGRDRPQWERIYGIRASLGPGRSTPLYRGNPSLWKQRLARRAKSVSISTANFTGVLADTHLDVWWDDVDPRKSVAAANTYPGPVPTSPPPPPAPVITNTPLPTPTRNRLPRLNRLHTPVNTPTYTPTQCPLLPQLLGLVPYVWLTYDDGNRNGIQDEIEGTISAIPNPVLMDNELWVPIAGSTRLAASRFAVSGPPPGPSGLSGVHPSPAA